MTRIVIDARLAGHSGIGVYLDQMLTRVVPRLAPWRPVILAGGASFAELASRLGAAAEVRPWNVRPLGIGNLWSIPPIAGPRDLLWTPHFNVPLVGRTPLAVTLHDLLPLALPRLTGPGQSVAVRLWLRAIRSRARIVFCDSAFTRREALARGALDPTRVIVTPLGVAHPWQALPPEIKPPMRGDDAARPAILFVGLLKRHKNVTRLLQAFDRVKARIPHRLVLVARSRGLRGVDPEAQRWIRALGDRVEQVEDLPLPDLVMRTRAADFAVLPSLHEGFGLPALEAMAVGTPVLAARAGALPEVCGDAAAYCDPLSVEDIARALLALASDPSLRTRLAAAGIARAACFSWDRCASATADALDTELGILRADGKR